MCASRTGAGVGEAPAAFKCTVRAMDGVSARILAMLLASWPNSSGVTVLCNVLLLQKLRETRRRPWVAWAARTTRGSDDMAEVSFQASLERV